ncbi:aldo/keto reductase [Enterococcus sp. HY326]|uniref:aldo/keto reductase n=1 Tax=Enterococcus sp. HY326 TaxID=2971265 RepID=UPI00224031C3|nr:aldo/keto reductase [Enterococcus sp. HY326]
MKKRQIKQTGIEISQIGLGANAVGGHNLYPNLSEKAGKHLVATAIENDINLIDTAYRYGNGRSEELIGEVIQNYDRSKIILATKAAHTDPVKDVFSNSPEFLTRSVFEALKRLKTDYLDIFYIHFPDEATDKRYAIEALQKLKDNGLIRAIGVSNFSLQQLKEANFENQVDIVEDKYNLLDRGNEGGIMSYCLERNIAFIPFFPLASGVLSGKYNSKKQLENGDFRSDLTYFSKENLHIVDTAIPYLSSLAESYKVSIADIVLNWYLMRKDITSVIPGAKNFDQVLSNLNSTKFVLTEKEWDKINHLFPSI